MWKLNLNPTQKSSWSINSHHPTLLHVSICIWQRSHTKRNSVAVNECWQDQRKLREADDFPACQPSLPQSNLRAVSLSSPWGTFLLNLMSVELHNLEKGFYPWATPECQELFLLLIRVLFGVRCTSRCCLSTSTLPDFIPASFLSSSLHRTPVLI